MKVNYHTHTRRCLHANGTEADYADAAMRCGLAELGFSDHAPFPDHDFGWRMTYQELDDYLAAVRAEKQRCAGHLTIYSGLEAEYLPQYKSYYQTLLSQKLDYLVLGEHNYISASGEICSIYNAKSTADFLDYAACLAEGMQTGFFRIIAHPDIMFLRPFAWDSNCTKACKIILDAARAASVILEYNANGIRKGKSSFPDGERYAYPHERFWKMVESTDIPVLAGSDCHQPEQMWDDSMKQAVRTLQSMNVNLTASLK
jgi:histidinol-phosphatase (PHP family)